MLRLAPPNMFRGALMWNGTAHAQARLAAHVPPGPAEHVRLARCAGTALRAEGGQRPPFIPHALRARRTSREHSTSRTDTSCCACGAACVASLAWPWPVL